MQWTEILAHIKVLLRLKNRKLNKKLITLITFITVNFVYNLTWSFYMKCQEKASIDQELPEVDAVDAEELKV